MPYYVNEDNSFGAFSKSWKMGEGKDILNNLFGTSIGETKVGWGGIILDIIGEVRLEMSNDITNNVVEGLGEKYKVYNDNVTIMPDILNVTGYVGSLMVDRANEGGNYIKTVTKIIGIIGSLVPSSSTTLANIKSGVKSATMAADFFTDFAENLRKVWTAEDTQGKALKYLSWLRQTQYPIIVDTPLGRFNQMMIKNMVITQPEETQDYFRVDATFQKWRQTKTASYKAGNNLTLGLAKRGVVA